MRVILDFARRYPRPTVIVLVALAISGTVEGLSVTAILPALNAALPGRSGETDETGRLVMSALESLGISPTLGWLLGVIVIGFTLRSLIVLLANRQVGYTVAQVATDLRLRLLRALLGARWEYYLSQPVGKFANAMSVEAKRSSRAFLYGATMAAAAIRLVVYVWIAMLVSWKATVIYLGVAVAVIYALGFLVRMAEKAGWKQTRILKSLSSGMTDSLQSVKPLKAMAREYLADAALAHDTQRLNRALRKEIFSKEALKALQFPVTTGLVAVGFYVGLVQWELPVATVMVLIILLTQVLSTIGKLQVHYQNLVVAESAYWSLSQTIAEATENVEKIAGVRTPNLEREIRLDDVTVAYEERTILDGVTITIPAGTITTLVGFSGAGKTTVLDLVTGLIKPSAGHVRVDDVSLDELDLRSWRRMIGYVPQENLLLHETILHNVTLGDAEVDEADAERALREAGVWDFVSALPEGIQTVVGERGARLSGGQRQRVMIARALVHSPRLLLLDEATSALDPESERALCETLESFRGRVTVLAISHQTALVDSADRVYRLKDGQATLEVDRLAADLAPPGTRS